MKIHDIDIFSTFQIGHPKNAEIHDFDIFSTLLIGHPEIPKIHHFDHFSHSPDCTEFVYLGTIQIYAASNVCALTQGMAMHAMIGGRCCVLGIWMLSVSSGT